MLTDYEQKKISHNSHELADYYNKQGMEEAFRRLELFASELIPLKAAICNMKPIDAYWNIKIYDFRKGVSFPPALFSFDNFLTDMRLFLCDHIGDVVILNKNDLLLSQNIFNIDSSSCLAVVMSVKNNEMIFFDLFAPENYTYHEEDREKLELLLKDFSKCLTKTESYQDVVFSQSSHRMICACPSLKKISKQIDVIGKFNILCLITGDTGVGKDVVAKALHEVSSRRTGKFIKVNCGAIPDSLIDSELFGYEKGAFTGANANKAGYFEQAEGGTIFLDEIGELSLSAQVRLLHVLEDGKIQRVGSRSEQKVNVRIIAATNKDLWKKCQEGTFREDLCYRLFVCHIHIPPLRERKDDIPMLIWYFLNQQTKDFQIPPKHFISKNEITRLMDYAWPGNVRELRHAVERALLYGQDSESLVLSEYTYHNMEEEKKELPANNDSSEKIRQIMPAIPEKDATLSDIPLEQPHPFVSFDEFAKNYLEKVLTYTKGKIKGEGGAATILKMDPGTLYYKLKKYNLMHLTKKQIKHS